MFELRVDPDKLKANDDFMRTHSKDCVNNKTTEVRAVPRTPYVQGERQAVAEIPDVNINPAYLNKEEYEAVTDLRKAIDVTNKNPTYPINAELQDVEASERTGFDLACRTIYIKAAKHLGATHPVMCFIRNLRD